MAADIQQLMALCETAVRKAGDKALEYWRNPGQIQVETKDDMSRVTQADRESEQLIVGLIRDIYPDDAILGEEGGASAGTSGRTWIIDPIDGTLGFTRGGSFWGPMIGVEQEGEIIAGAMRLPALDKLYKAGKGLGCFRNGLPCKVSDVSSLEEATLSLGQLLTAPEYQPTINQLSTEAYHVRCYGDLAGLAMVLDRTADVWIEAGVKPWDLGPVPILVAEAGGESTSFAGRPGVREGTMIAGAAELVRQLQGRLQP